MAQAPEEFDRSKDVNTCANFDLSVSFVNNFTGRKTIFATDQEVYIDSQHPLILLNDTNANSPLPPFRQAYQSNQPNQQQKRPEKLEKTDKSERSDKKENVSQILSDLELESPGIVKRDRSSPRKSILKTRVSSPSKRREQSQNDSRGRRPSNSMSNPRSDTIGGKDLESDMMSPSKSAEEDEVDIFHNKDEKVVKESFANLKKKLRDFLDSSLFNLFIGIITLYTLFGQDLCEAVFEAPQDLGFDIASLVCMGIFTVEMLLTMFAHKGYVFSFFFWLDLISTVSILFDIEFIMDEILFGGMDVTAQANKNTIAGTIGVKAGRVFRVVRLIRLVKLYKQVMANNERRELKKRIQQITPDSLDLSQMKQFSATKEFKNNSNNQSFEARAKAANQRSSILILTPADATPVSPLKGRSDTRVTDRRASRISRGLEGGSNKNLDKPSSALDVSIPSRRKSVRIQTRIHSTPSANANANTTTNEMQDLTLKESRVGKQLSELTTKRVIIMVLALLLFIPMFSADFFFDPPDSQSYQMNVLQKLLNSSATQDAKMKAVYTWIVQQQSNQPPLVYLTMNSVVLHYDTTVDLTDLRAAEGSFMSAPTTQGTLTSIVSQRYSTQLDSWLSIGRTFFISIVLTFGALAFNKDARDLILRPLERIIQKVNKIAKNPLLAKDEEIIRDQGNGFDNETIHIENAIVKIGGLLALGFGDAGSAIIAQNIARSGDINPMLPGKKKAAIYGFCDIRNFTDATEVLQEDVMVFVNSIADVVHSLVDKYTGQANKNIGDAFLLVWKFPEDAVMEMSDGQLEVISNQVTVNMADCALISFLKIYARINRDPTLLKYRENVLLNSRLPNYKVKMGFGLHVGWAIEGAIGSEFKIDASYLSPNVNMASRLEAATKQYGVPLLFSGDLYETLSEEMQNISRMIDLVTVKGSVKPIELYTVDMDVEEISIAKDRAEQPKELRKVKQKQKKDFIKEMVENDYVSGLLETDKELKYILRNRNEEFDSIFSSGFDAYIDGDWSVAKKKFETCLTIKSDDGPTKNLMGFLAEYDYICPEDWNGYHVLTEK